MSLLFSLKLTLDYPPPPLSAGQCISRFTNRKVPYCVKFNPDEDKQNLFVAGMSDKKIVQVRSACAALLIRFGSGHPLHVDFPVDQADAHTHFLCIAAVPTGAYNTLPSHLPERVRVFVRCWLKVSLYDRTRASH